MFFNGIIRLSDCVNSIIMTEKSDYIHARPSAADNLIYLCFRSQPLVPEEQLLSYSGQFVVIVRVQKCKLTCI